jgi:hypothetical protein
VLQVAGVRQCRRECSVDKEIGIGDGDAGEALRGRWLRGTFKPHLPEERGLGGLAHRLPLIRTEHWTNIKNDNKELRIFVTVVELSRVIMLYGVQRSSSVAIIAQAWT